MICVLLCSAGIAGGGLVAIEGGGLLAAGSTIRGGLYTASGIEAITGNGRNLLTGNGTGLFGYGIDRATGSNAGDYFSFGLQLLPAADALGTLSINGTKSLYGILQGYRAEANAAAGGTQAIAGVLPKGIALTFDPVARSWTTPVGLVYDQGSIQGNRILHVLDHTVPNPAKPTHTLFSVDRNEVLGLIDEAWLKRGAPLPSDAAAYVIPMGRVVGKGGETNLKIIVKPNTTKVITAYPVR